jgi:hypothetical protein
VDKEGHACCDVKLVCGFIHIFSHLQLGWLGALKIWLFSGLASQQPSWWIKSPPFWGFLATPFWMGSSNTNQQVILDLLLLANSHDIPWCSHLSGWPIATNNSVTVGKHPWQFIGLCPHTVPLMALTSFLPSSPKHG